MSTLNAYSRPDILFAWKELYTNSLSSDRDCQLCHERVDGGDGWNAYGFDIRTVYIDQLGSQNLPEAFRLTEPFDSDGDVDSLSNLDEINQGLDPGWKPGNNNTIFFKDGTALNDQAPPFSEVVIDSSELCVPILAKNKSLTLICF